ncbi:MAG: hypothetical protein NXI20_28255 [bacterium]|nr:hypothetical protein [bacterium]
MSKSKANRGKEIKIHPVDEVHEEVEKYQAWRRISGNQKINKELATTELLLMGIEAQKKLELY